METLLDWLSQYSTPVVALLALGVVAIYVLRNVLENAISAQFNKHTRQIQLLLERRARFEEKILLDQYEMVKSLQAKIIGISTDLNRHRNDSPVEGLFKGMDIPRLTDVFGQLEANRYLLRDVFYQILCDQAQTLLALARVISVKEGTEWNALQDKYKHLQDEFHQSMLVEFGIEEISMTSRKDQVMKHTDTV